MKQGISIFLIIVLLALVAAGARYVFIGDDSDTKDRGNSSRQDKQSDQPVNETITATGELHCLVPKGDGPHTMECAFGLKQADGTVYGLGYDDPTLIGTIPTGTQIEVTGTLAASTNSKFETEGTIKATSVKQL